VTLLQILINTPHLLVDTANNNRIFDSPGSLVTVLTCLSIGVSLIALFAHFAVMGLHV